MDAAVFGKGALSGSESWIGEYASKLRPFALDRRWMYLSSVGTVVLLFVADMVLPRGATAAVGYCLIPVLAVGTRRSEFLIGATILCTLLTWVAFFVEPAGVASWPSAFERVMVTSVVWLAFCLVWLRAAAMNALARQARSLEATGNELQRSNDELQLFASVVAHDLRGPLNTIGLTAELLASGSASVNDAERDEMLASITRQVARMSRLIQRLLTYGRAGSGELRQVPCDCNRVLADVEQNLSADLDKARAVIASEPLPVLRADPVLLATLFQNLIENAIKYAGEDPPRIHISAQRQPPGWLISVRDNGIGIAPAEAEHIFESFRQIKGEVRRQRGVGLGLATCKRIVERHGGQLGVKSSPGQGSAFHFSIPESRENAAVGSGATRSDAE
jgi:signal transduction histidine kinase